MSAQVSVLPLNFQGEAVEEMGEQMVSIGLVPGGAKSVGHQPGWRRGSVGYHGDDGHVFVGSGRGQVRDARGGQQGSRSECLSTEIRALFRCE